MSAFSNKFSIAIVGGTSQIALGLLPHLSKKYHLTLYSRNNTKLDNYTGSLSNVESCRLDEFGSKPFDLVINCIGNGDPSIQRRMGKELFCFTERMDLEILEHVSSSTCGYIFLSSVAVYGENICFPVNPALVDMNPSRSYYGEAKRQAELRHEAHGGPIVDLRIFGYVSEFLSLDSGFLLSQIFRACRNKDVFIPKGADIFRDYISQDELAAVICYLIDAGIKNERIDIISRLTTSRNRILNVLQQCYGLELCWESASDSEMVEHPGVASSIDHPVLAMLNKTSADTVLKIAEKILGPCTS